MARIPLYHTQVDPQAHTSGRYVSAQQDVSRGLTRLGQSFHAIGSTLARQEERDALFQVRRDMSQQRVLWSETLAQRKEEAEQGAPGFSQAILDEYDASMEAMREERADTPHTALHALEGSQLEFREKLAKQAQAFEMQSRVKKKRLDAEAFRNDASRLVYNDPSQFVYEKEQFSQFIDSLGLEGNSAQAVKTESLSMMAVSAIQGLIAQGHLEDAQSALKDGPLAEHIDGVQAGTLTRTVEVEQRRHETQKQVFVAQAQAGLRSARERMTAGYDLPPEESAHLKTLVEKATDPGVKAAWDILRALQDDVKNWRKLTPVQLEQEIQASLEPALHRKGASSFELERYDAARNLLTGMRTQIKTDPLGWAAAQGLTTLPGLDMSDGASLQERAAVSESVRGLYGTTAFFTPVELDAFQREWKTQSPEDKLAVALSLRENAGSMATTALQQISKDGLVDAYIGGLALVGPEFQAVATNAWRGLDILRKDKSRVPDSGETFLDAVGAAGRYLPPETLMALRTTADALYVHAGQDTPGLFDTDVYGSALSSALGSSSGGIAEINDVKTFLPPSISQSDFEDFLENATGGVWERAAVSKSRPVYRDGSLVDPADIEDEGVFYMVGPNRYVVFMESDNLPILDEKGEHFTVMLSPDVIREVNQNALD